MGSCISIHNSAAPSRVRVFYISHKRQLKCIQNLRDGDIAIVAPDRKCITRSYIFQNERWSLYDQVDVSGQC